MRFHCWRADDTDITGDRGSLKHQGMPACECACLCVIHLWYCAWRNWNSSLMRSSDSGMVNLKGWPGAWWGAWQTHTHTYKGWLILSCLIIKNNIPQIVPGSCATSTSLPSLIVNRQNCGLTSSAWIKPLFSQGVVDTLHNSLVRVKHWVVSTSLLMPIQSFWGSLKAEWKLTGCRPWGNIVASARMETFRGIKGAGWA